LYCARYERFVISEKQTTTQIMCKFKYLPVLSTNYIIISLFYPATLFAVCVGTVDGWTSPALPFLQRWQGYSFSNNSFHHVVTDDEASWIGSLVPLGALAGAIPAGYLANLIGRRRLLLLLTVPMLLGWMIIIIAQDSVRKSFPSSFWALCRKIIYCL